MADPDIFLSYNREDAARAKHFADGFEAEGFDVWWDVALRSGEAYDKVTEDALRNAKAVVVLWSPRSVESRWCRAEATLADRRKVLMPATIEPCERPIMFELVQTAELSHWRGDVSDAAWQAFASHVREFIRQEAAHPASTKPSEQLPGLDQVSVVVLPFANMSRDEEQEYFADGMTEDIITDLSQVSAMMVIARNTAFTFKGRHVDVPTVARQLNVTHVLEGSVRKAGSKVRVNAQLIDGSSGGHLWAQRWDRDLDDIFELQDELSHAIVEALKVKLQPGEREALADRGTNSLEAYDLNLRARALYGQIGTEETERSAALAREAIQIDPNFIQAYRQLAASLEQLQFLTPEHAAEIDAERQALIERVAEIAPNDPFFVFIRCRQLVSKGDLVEAERLNDTVAAGTYLGTFWACPEFFGFYVGRFGSVLEVTRKRVQTDPMDSWSSVAFHDLLDINGFLDEADAENQRNRDLPSDRSPMELSYFLRGKGRVSQEELTQRFSRLVGLKGHASTIPLLAELEPVVHDRAAAIALIRQAVADPGYRNTLMQLWIALLAAYYDDVDVAIEALRHAFVESEHVLELRCPLWQSPFKQVRLDPRFKDIVRELGLVDYWRETGKWGDIARPVGDNDFEIIG